MECRRKLFCGFHRRCPRPGAPVSIRCRAFGVDRQRVVQLPCAVRSRSPVVDLYCPGSAVERSQNAGDRITGFRNYLRGGLAARGVRCRLTQNQPRLYRAKVARHFVPALTAAIGLVRDLFENLFPNSVIIHRYLVTDDRDVFRLYEYREGDLHEIDKTSDW